MTTKEQLQEITERLEKYKEWAKDMPVGEMTPHKPTYKYIARDYCADVNSLITALEEAQAYTDKLVDFLPCLPKDVEVMKKANHDFAIENDELKTMLDEEKEVSAMHITALGLDYAKDKDYLHEQIKDQGILLGNCGRELRKAQHNLELSDEKLTRVRAELVESEELWEETKDFLDQENGVLRSKLAEAQDVTKGHKVSKDCDVLRHQLEETRHSLRLSQQFGKNSAYAHLLALTEITEKQIEIDSLRKEVKLAQDKLDWYTNPENLTKL